MRYEEVETEVGRKYFRYWENALKVILGWSQEAVETWVEQFRDELNGDDGMFYHYHPGEYLVPAFLPLETREAAAKRGVWVKINRQVIP